MNLSVMRKTVQGTLFFLMVYGGYWLGPYTTDKLSKALPALSCAYDPLSADYCALVPLQHQIHHGLERVFAGQMPLWMALLPIAITLGTFVVLFVLFSKAFCGWVCPLGFFQDMLSIVGQKLGLQGKQSLTDSTVDKIRPVKWLMLSLLVFGFPLLAAAGYVDEAWGAPFCAVCPSRIMTTLMTGSTDQLYVDSASASLTGLSIAGVFLFGLMISLGLTVRQPFCRICPMLALQAIFRKVGLLRLVKNATPRCDKCGLCANACPMDIREIHTEMHKYDITYPGCTLCGRCVEFCPDDKVLQLRYAGLPIFSSTSAYFKRRKQSQKQWETISLANLHRKPKAAQETQ
ncbi:MAG: 4Fe-4S ferredoxin [Proteobacteria bacterium ST_bin11]|nr:MAG: 4Fe-4S ferredoxin [Proteobacteria bacterium ST_bin11]